ncbi:SGNH/GDSL hydrolase family protein [Bradyrhizobium sp. NP1]|uniref:SGNH/GDSL hydrolase family protein n=1 Tax=Bradyrhizobium sp. NP1 TaxID=3049772 RepID=UPI0025A4D8C5|nr:SGNH/GDSL hydrolase family protein [Bradyrhizobium sp. NP1]WJR75244.1 SGNH/GDSL hydrolase family protein [Bradyrhizobium sp. NP1]
MVDGFAFADLPDDVIGLRYPLPRLAAAIRSGGLVRIVAMGSSSTAGRADVVPFPHWLEMYLRSATGNARIDVINRGRGGEEADKELLRFDTDIFPLEPAMVIWQVGTNAVFHRQDYDIDSIAADIETGLKRLCAEPAKMDVMLIDPQYVTAMLLDDKADLSERMVKLISEKAERAGVNLFHRWALMRHWHVHNDISFERMLDPTDPDKLHQSDASTQRFSRGLCDTILKAVASAPAT